ncbi:Werner syndrome ATP-dependent helicase [Cladochytrium tenue]|nr:Werner syndrome ATP-dependent helicase [Cladochytrium tenue]
MKSKRFLGRLDRLHDVGALSLVVVDEAHSILALSYSFRRDYRTLNLLRIQWPHVPILALTATATPDVQRDIVETLGLRCDFQRFAGQMRRPNLCYKVAAKPEGAKAAEALLALPSSPASHPMLWASCTAAHAARHIQETGRAGRDSQPSRCILLYQHADVFRQSVMVFSETPHSLTRGLYRLVAFATSRTACRARSLEAYLGESVADAVAPGGDDAGQPDETRCGMCDACKVASGVRTVAAAAPAAGGNQTGQRGRRARQPLRRRLVVRAVDRSDAGREVLAVLQAARRAEARLTFTQLVASWWAGKLVAKSKDDDDEHDGGGEEGDASGDGTRNGAGVGVATEAAGGCRARGAMQG